MKKVFTTTMAVVALLWLAAWTSACDDDHKPANVQDQITKTWSVSNAGFVKKDGIALTSEYRNLGVTFNHDGTYSTAGAKKLFYTSGTWEWAGTGATHCILNGDLPVTVTELTKTTLRLQFTMDEDHVNPNGRTTAVVGSYELSLQAN